MLQADPLPLGLLVWRGGDSQHRSLVRNVAHDARLRANSGVVAEFQMSRNSRLRSDHAIISQPSAAGETHLAHDQTMLANVHVVRDVHEVVNLGALADDGGAECSAINGRVG